MLTKNMFIVNSHYTIYKAFFQGLNEIITIF